MIHAEQLHDALTLLPEDLLISADVLRRKKRIVWKPVAALAACMAMVIGLWFLFPGAVSSENNGSAERGDGIVNGSSLSGIKDQANPEPETSCEFITATVTKIEASYLEISTDTFSTITVKLEQLKTVPELMIGQRIQIYCEDFSDLSQPIVPYQISIVENEKED